MPPQELLPPQSRKPDTARRLRDLIRSRIVDGEFSLGRRLPDDAQLMAEYRAGRNVVRTALAELQREGLISRVQGAGTFAVVQKTRHTLQGAHGVGWSLRGGIERLSSRLVSVDHVSAPLGVAMRLGSVPHTECLVVDVVTEIDGQPIMFLTSYLADAAAKQAVAEALTSTAWRGDWYEILTAAGFGPVQREVVAEAAGVDSFIAPHLGLQVADPVMRFERRLLLGERGVPEYGFSFCRGDRLTFAMSDGTAPGMVS